MVSSLYQGIGWFLRGHYIFSWRVQGSGCNVIILHILSCFMNVMLCESLRLMELEIGFHTPAAFAHVGNLHFHRRRAYALLIGCEMLLGWDVLPLRRRYWSRKFDSNYRSLTITLVPLKAGRILGR